MATSKKPIPLLVRAKETTPPSTTTGGRLISDVAALTKVTDALLFILENPADGMAYKGTFAQLKAEVAGDKPYGILQVVDGSTSSPVMTQAISGTAILTAWNTNGISSGLTVDYTAGKLTATVAGTYEVDMSISFSGQLSKTFVFEIYKDDVSASPTPTSTGFKMTRKLGTGGDVGSASLSGLVSLAVGDSVMIYVSSTDGGNTITVHQSQLKVSEI